MSTNRGISPDTWDSPTGSSSCLISSPPDACETLFPYWKAVASRDGTRLAVPMRATPEESRLFTWTLDEAEPHISEPFLSITDLHPHADRDFTFLCQTDEGWAVSTPHKPWEFQVEFAWNLLVTEQGVTACETQEGRRYTPVVGDTPWPDGYENTFGLTLTASGEKSAAVVQTTPIAEGDLATFSSGCFTLATDQGPWPESYLGAFTPSLSADGAVAAVDVRLTPYDYTIAVNHRCWASAWPSVWAPVVHPEGTSVCAPVKEPQGWTLACDGEPAWPGHFIQLWELIFSPNGRRLAAVVSPEFGKWTLALDGVPWNTRVDGHLSRPVFSPCGSRIGCTGSHKGKAVVLIDDCPVHRTYDSAWDPIFSPFANHVAVRVKNRSGYTVLVDGSAIQRQFLWMPDPSFTPDGKHLMICGIEKNGTHYRYTREFIALN